jgi:hypothetical protein
VTLYGFHLFEHQDWENMEGDLTAEEMLVTHSQILHVDFNSLDDWGI